MNDKELTIAQRIEQLETAVTKLNKLNLGDRFKYLEQQYASFAYQFDQRIKRADELVNKVSEDSDYKKILNRLDIVDKFIIAVGHASYDNEFFKPDNKKEISEINKLKKELEEKNKRIKQMESILKQALK